jgi:hypothetical protein
VQRDDHRDLPYVPADRHDLLPTSRHEGLPPRSTSWANLAAGETNVTASGPRSLLCVGPPLHPVADEIHRDCDPCEEERCDAPGSCVTAAVSARVCEDAS